MLGDRGERLAVRTLKKAGFRIIARNWTGRRGEIDIVARDGRTIVFVEVKTRRDDVDGGPARAVDRTKERMIREVAAEWIAGYVRRGGRRDQLAVRYDVIAVVWPEGEPPTVTHYRGAFGG